MTTTPFPGSQAHLIAELDRIRALVEAAEGTDQPTEIAGGTDVDPSDLPLALPEADRERIEKRTARIEGRRQATDEPLRLARVADACGLSRRHLDCLLLALAPRLDPAISGQYERLQDHTLLSTLTVGLPERLFARTPAQRLAAGRLLAAASPLLRRGLLSVAPPPEGYPTRRGRSFPVPDRVVEALRGGTAVDPDLRAQLRSGTDGETPPITLVSAGTDTSDVLVEPSTRESLDALASGRGRRWYGHGPDSAVIGRAVEAVCETETFLRADLPTVRAEGKLDAVAREATLLDRPLHLSGAASATVAAVFDRLDWLAVDLVVTGPESWMPPMSMDATVEARIEVPHPSTSLRRQFWAARQDQLPEGTTPGTLASTFRLTQTDLTGAFQRAQARADEGVPAASEVYAACREQSADGLDAFAEQVDPGYGWDDIELPAETASALTAVRDHVTQRDSLEESWGFDTGGVVALFEGPSGTGKTMAAEVLADAVGMGLYRLDLSTVVSKYVGETESALDRVFTAAEDANAVLLFDEADAVFGDRAEVTEATDRYANAEVNYLLQRIEAHEGVVVLTTNYESNIDTAFSRRIDHTVSFDRPDEPVRERIWRGAVPEAASTADIDYGFLASFPLTGGQIQTAVRTAAIDAATDDKRVQTSNLVGAVHRELDAAGELLDPTAFEPYRDSLDT